MNYSKPSCRQYHDSILRIIKNVDYGHYLLREFFNGEILSCDKDLDIFNLRTEFCKDIPMCTQERVFKFKETKEDKFICRQALIKHRDEIYAKLKPWWKFW